MPFRSPEIFAQTTAIVAYQRVGGIQDITVRAIVLLQFDDLGNTEIPFKIFHVTGIRATECIDALIVIANHKYSGPVTGEQL